jgi:transposase-like protein
LYHCKLSANWHFKSIGDHWSQSPKMRIPRFLCRRCRRSFSSQTFSSTCWLKRPDILAQLLTKTCGGMANRQIARDLSVAPSTIDGQIARLGRHCLLLHATLMKQAKPSTTVAIDGFVSFEHSLFWPFHHHLAIEPASDFIVYLTDSEVRRSGSMTPARKRESQTGDDRVVEASAVECGANGCICGVAELPEGPEREDPL